MVPANLAVRQEQRARDHARDGGQPVQSINVLRLPSSSNLASSCRALPSPKDEFDAAIARQSTSQEAKADVDLLESTILITAISWLVKAAVNFFRQKALETKGASFW